jgi:ABC-type branched-subunit amino acid transport system substrate-binding protein
VALCAVIILSFFVFVWLRKKQVMVVKQDLPVKIEIPTQKVVVPQPQASSTVNTSEENVIKIGTILGLTGSTRETHLKILEGLNLRFNKANSSGELGNKKIILTALDHEYIPAVAVKKMEELVQNNKIDIIISPSGTEVLNACIQKINY